MNTILEGTQVPHVDKLIPCRFNFGFDDGEYQAEVKVTLTNPADIFDEMTRQGCKLNLVTFGYYMEK